MIQNLHLEGTIHGKTIELASDPGLPNGEKVVVDVRAKAWPFDEEALRQAFGSWKDMPDFDAWLAETYAARRADPRNKSE